MREHDRDRNAMTAQRSGARIQGSILRGRS
jgi:hypothetical protein